MQPFLSSPPAPAFPGISISRDDDARVVVQAKGDPHAFALLYARYFDPVYRYCNRRLGVPRRQTRRGGEGRAGAMSVERTTADRLNDHLDAVVADDATRPHDLDPSLAGSVELFFVADDAPGLPHWSR